MIKQIMQRFKFGVNILQIAGALAPEEFLESSLFSVEFLNNIRLIQGLKANFEEIKLIKHSVIHILRIKRISGIRTNQNCQVWGR